MKFLRWLLHRPTWQKLPLLPHHLATAYDRRDVDHDIALLMQQTQVRSPRSVRLLMKRYKASSPRELLDVLPSRHRPRRLRKKMLGMVRRALGMTSYDPTVKIVRPYRRQQGRRRV